MKTWKIVFFFVMNVESLNGKKLYYCTVKEKIHPETQKRFCQLFNKRAFCGAMRFRDI